MKKFICLLIAVICVFGLISCGEDSENALFFEIVNTSTPKKIITQTSVDNGEDVFSGRYETIVNDKNFDFSYEYERYALPEEKNDNYIKTVTGNVYYKDGLYSADGQNWTTQAPNAPDMRIALNLSHDLLGEYTLNESKMTLQAVLTAEQAEKVLGISLNDVGEAGVTLIVSHNGKYLTNMSLTYTNETATVTIDTSYTYN